MTVKIEHKITSDDTDAGMLSSPQEYIFIKCLRPVWLHGQVNVASVLAAQIVLDIHTMCRGQFPSYYRQLLSTEQFVHEGLKFVE